MENESVSREREQRERGRLLAEPDPGLDHYEIIF